MRKAIRNTALPVNVREQAIHACVNLKYPAVGRSLLRIVRDASEVYDLRLLAACAIGWLRCQNLIDSLTAILSESDDEAERQVVARSLWNMWGFGVRDRRIPPALIKRINDPAETDIVAGEAAAGIGNMWPLLSADDCRSAFDVIASRLTSEVPPGSTELMLDLLHGLKSILQRHRIPQGVEESVRARLVDVVEEARSSSAAIAIGSVAEYAELAYAQLSAAGRSRAKPSLV